MQKTRDFLSLIWLPLFALAAVAMFYSAWTLLNLPSREEVIALSRIYFEQYGLVSILVAAIIEAALFIGWYFPGSLVIVLGVILAGKDIELLLGVFMATTIGFWIAYTFNFYVGKYGWYRLLTALGFQEALAKAQAQLEHYGPRAIFFTSFHPNLAALTSTAAGILQMPFVRFATYTVAASLLWNTFWTVVGYSFGDYSAELIGPKFVVPFLVIWMSVLVFRKWYNSRRTHVNQDTSSDVPAKPQ